MSTSAALTVGVLSNRTLTANFTRIPQYTVSINQNPANAGTISGDSTVLTANGGIKYKWSTQDTTNSLVVKRSDNYVVTVTNTEGCSATKSITVTENALPNPQITGSTTICTGSSTTLTATGGVSYKWSNNATTASITVSQANTYSVTVTDANGCKANTSKTLTLGNALSPNITGDTAICQGSSTVLTTSGGTSYLWSTGQITPTISVTQSGTYYVTVSNAANCRKIDSIKIEKVSRPIANFSFTLIGGQVTFLNNSFGTGFNWNFGNGISSTIPNPNINYTANGTYTITLIVSNAFGCFDTISKTVQVTRVSTDEFSKKLEVSVSPNPFNTQLTVRFATLLDFGKTDYLFITNILGQEIYRQNINTQQTTIETGNWTQGIYSLNMSYKGRIHVLKKVVKIK